MNFPDGLLALTLELALWAASMMYPSGSGGGFFFSTLAKKLIHGAAALAILDIYISVAAPFMLTDYPSELSHLFVANGQPQVGVGVAGSFDTVWSTVRSLGFVIQGRLPDSWVPSVIMLMAAMVIFKAVGFVMVLFAFGTYISIHLLAVVVVAIGPLMIALAAVPSTRRYAWGWLGVVLWTIASVAMISLVLGIAISVITQECQVLGAMDQAVSVYDQVDGFLGIVGALFLLACAVTAQPWVAHSIFGGAASAMGGVAAGGAAVGGYVAAAGRSITGAMR
jgi:TrbL/VirB6 plasmid conjugal transfer protein